MRLSRQCGERLTRTGPPHKRRSAAESGLRAPGEDRPGREGSRVALGQTQAGRYLRVIYVPDPKPGSIFVITAYQLTGKPLVAYRRRGRKQR